jgi:mono/diheme cytochrome c family protein
VRSGGGRMPTYAAEIISDQDLEIIHAWLQSQ